MKSRRENVPLSLSIEAAIVDFDVTLSAKRFNLSSS